MADTYRGLTIRFGGDTTKLNDSLRGVARAASTAQRALKQLRSASKLDPGNMAVARNQLKLYGDTAITASAKLKKLAIAQKQLKATKLSDGRDLASYAKGLDSVSLHAETLRQRYNEVNASLENTKKRLQDLYKASGGKGELFSKSASEIDKILVGLQRTGELTQAARAEARTLTNEYKSLKSIWGDAYKGNELGKMLQQMEAAENESVRLKASVAEVRQEFARLGTARMEKFTSGIQKGRTALRALKAEGENLDKYIKMDPTNMDLAIRRMNVYQEEIRVAESELRRLQSMSAKMKGTAGFLSSDAASGKANAAALTAQYEKANAALAKELAHISAIQGKLQVARDAARGLADAHRQSSGDMQRAKASVQQYETELKKAQENARLLKADMSQIGRDLSFTKVNGEIERMTASMKHAQAAMTTVNAKSKLTASSLLTLGMSLYQGLTPAAMMFGTYAVQSAKDVDGAYRDMRKTVNGTEEQFESLRNAALEYSKTHFTSADQILEIEAIGGQLGIATKDLEAFSKTISNLNIATNIEDAEELSIQFGKMASVMHLTSDEYDKFADSLVRLGNNEPALESDIMKITTRFMGMGAIVGMSADEMLAFATAATATGQGAESAGTSLQRTMGRIEAAVAGVSDGMRNMEDATEEDIEAFETAQGKLQEYADIAGMTAEEFATAWEERPAEAMQAFIEGLKGIDDAGGSVDKALKDLGITGVRDRQLLEGLVNTTDVLSDSLKMSKDAWDGVSDQWGESGDAAREAQRKTEGFSGSLKLLANNFQFLATEMGESLKPVFDLLIPAVQGLTDGFKNLPGPMKTAISSIIGVAAASGMLVTGASTWRTVVDNWRKGSEEAGSAMNTLARKNAEAAKSGEGVAAAAEKVASGNEKAASSAKNASKGAEEVAKSSEKASAKTKAAAKSMDEAAKSGQTMAAETGAAGESTKKMATGAGMASNAMKKLGGAMKMVGKAFAFSVALGALFSLVDAFQQASEKAESFKKATSGLHEAMKTNADTTNATNEALKSVSSGYSSFGVSVDDATKRQAELADKIREIRTGAAESSATLDVYRNKVHELAGKSSLTAAEQEALKVALEQIDAACGTSFASVENLNGAWRDQVSAIDEAIAAQKREIEVQAVKNQLEESVKQRVTNQQAYADALKNVQTAAEKTGESAFDLAAQYERLSNPEIAENAGRFANDLEVFAQMHPEFVTAYTDLQKIKAESYENEQAIEGFTKQLDVAANAAQSGASAAEQWVSSWGGTGYLQAVQKDTTQLGIQLDALGVNLEQLGNQNQEQLALMLENWDGSAESLAGIMSDLGVEMQSSGEVIGTGLKSGFGDKMREILNDTGGDVDALKSRIGELNDFVMDDKHIEITDDGTIKVVDGAIDELQENVEQTEENVSVNYETNASEESGDVEEFNEEVLQTPDNKLVKFGTVGVDIANMAISMLRSTFDQVPDNKNTNVTTTGTQQANYEIQGVGNTIQLTPDGKHIAISSNATEAAWQLQNVTGQANLIPPYRQVITATPTAGESAGALSNVAGMAFGIPQAVYTAVGAPGAVQATGEMNASTAAANAIPGSEQTSVSAPGATSATSQMQATRSAAYSIPRSVSVSVHANTWGAISAINSVRSALWSINGQSASTYVHTYAIRHERTVKDAQGSIGFNRNLLDNILMQLPKHAAGGIVDRPTLTSTGWIGEDGAEAIIPLDNPKYVGTFANALAKQLDGGSGGTTYNLYMNDIRVNDDPAIQAAMMNLLYELQRKGAMNRG